MDSVFHTAFEDLAISVLTLIDSDEPGLTVKRFWPRACQLESRFSV